MIRFDAFEKLGIVAAMSDKSDGDCNLRSVGHSETACKVRHAFCRRLGVDAADLVCAQQVHGVEIASAAARDRGKGAAVRHDGFPATDGILTAVSRLPLAILAADCVPIYLFDPTCRVGGLIHAGRRGTQAGISGRAVALLQAQFNLLPKNLHALIGPSAGPCCYEVGPEMARRLAQAGFPVRGRKLDLWETNARQLAAAGLLLRRITVAGICTVCDGRFFSYRAERTSARNMALLML